jgi:hypothetical protein
MCASSTALLWADHNAAVSRREHARGCDDGDLVVWDSGETSGVRERVCVGYTIHPPQTDYSARVQDSPLSARQA